MFDEILLSLSRSGLSNGGPEYTGLWLCMTAYYIIIARRQYQEK